MKGRWRHLRRNGAGTVSVTAEDTDDIWALFNIIAPGDEVECATLRKVQMENSQGTTVDTQKIKLVLAVKVEKVDVDLVAGCLRINGKNVKENKHVKLGSYHTLEVELDRPAKITKGSWDVLSLQFLEQSCSDSGKYDVAAVILQEGLAYVCSVAGAGSIRVLAKIEANFPKKRIGSAYEKATDSFYVHVIDAMLEKFEFPTLKAIVLASPGLFREELHKRLLDLAIKNEERKFILDAKSKFIKSQTASGQVGALEDALKEPRLAALLTETKTARETKLLDQFHRLNAHTPDMVAFGWSQVQKAACAGAVKTLLLSDSLFRSKQVEERRKSADLIDEVRGNGGAVQIFLGGSSTEAELDKITGVAAVLNFPLE